VGWIVDLDEDLTQMVRASHHLLQNGETGADAGELTRLEDACDAPVVVRETKSVAYPNVLFLGVVFVDEDVLIALEWAAGEEVETSAHSGELIDVEPGDGIEAGQWLHYRADSLGDVGQFGDERNKRVGHGSGAEPDDGRTRGTNHDIGANAASAPRRAIEGAITHSHEGEDHRHFDGNGQYAEGCAHRAVAEIGDDELVDQFAIDNG
jgi:hypothetical protein